MRYINLIFLFSLASAISHAELATNVLATTVKISLPPETLFLKESNVVGYSLASASCITCHSAEYIRTQPKLTRNTWKAEVTKMKKVFGAPIPDGSIDPLVDYLVLTYGVK